MRRRLGLAVKRGVDIVGALLGLVVGGPLLVAIAVVVRWRLGSPVLFRQLRSGRGGRLFVPWKFRTMTQATDGAGRLLPDGARLTRLGRLLRGLSLDELPQLVNVLRGEMSLVGPRPLLPKYDEWYGDTERRRFDVRPGITGLAQVSGRNTVRWNDRLALDVAYVDGWSLWLDLRILAQTVRGVVVRDGVVEDPRAHLCDLDHERAQQETEEMAHLRTELRELLRTG